MLVNQLLNNIENVENERKIIKTDDGAKDGQNKCSQCGSTDISVNAKTGKLRCNFCRHEFEFQKIKGFEENIKDLEGEVVGSGIQDIVADTNNVVTFKCSSCGAEVVIDTAETTQARCHWCRNTLSVNQQIPNGAVPDVVLPFNITKADAKEQIEKFVGKRKFFAHPKFKEEFTTDNIMGVYFPYMLVDINSHARFVGQGEHEVRRYTSEDSNNRDTYYDADLYDVEREFDLTIEGLTVESSIDKLNKNDSSKTNNIINSIMPFDIENCVKYNANYLKGFASEKRDTNIDDLRPIVDEQSKDIARFVVNDSLKNYDRGVCWQVEQLNVKGKQWKPAYLPVWLYSYQQEKNEDKKTLHYVAVNARTKETMGSVPIHIPKLFGVSALVEALGFLVTLLVTFEYEKLFLLSGFVFFIINYLRYRNSNARHYYEKETKTKMFNLRKMDVFIRTQRGLTNSNIVGVNNTKVRGQNISERILNSIKK